MRNAIGHLAYMRSIFRLSPCRRSEFRQCPSDTASWYAALRLASGKRGEPIRGRQYAAAFYERGGSVGFLSASSVEIRGCPVHTNSDFADEFGERPLARYIGQSTRKSPTPAVGRERAAA